MNSTYVKLTNKQLEQKCNFIKDYISAKNAADGSKMDSNANVCNKNVATLAGEIHKDINIQIKRYMVSQYIKQLYGEELANEYNRQIEEHEIYIHDESHPFFPYCVSITMYPFLMNGLKGLGGESSAPKHLDSFCGNFNNLVYAISSQFAGAVATVEFLMYFDYFARKDYGDNYLEEQKHLITQKFQECVYTLNQPASARNYQSVFWNISIFDEKYFKSIFDGFIFPDGDTPNWNTLKKLQAFFMDWFNEERRKALLTFPVVTAAILNDGDDIADKEFLDMCAGQDSKGNSFFKYQSSSADSLASCCRLRNELNENTFSYSLGAGGVSTGSLNVITLNANRFVQNCVKELEILNREISTEEKINYIKEKLKEQIEKIHNYQLATKAYLKSYLDAEMLPVYQQGYIDMNKQFLTVGINGLLESAEFLGFTANNNEEYKNYISEFLSVIYNANKEARLTKGVMFNTELVPAENVAVKNYKWDKKDGYKVPTDRICYNSYLYRVEDTEIDIVDKYILHGKDNLQYLDGGSALHLNLEEYPTKESYKKLYQLAAKTGCNYWTTNIPVTVCEDCGYINKNKEDHCIKCGSKNISLATRIIGYLKKISSFSSDRQKEAELRYYGKFKQ